MALTFYYGSGSPFAWRVWLALEHKGLSYDLKVLSFDKREHKTPDYLAINPRGEVPALVDDGFAIFESNAIVEYIAERWPEGPTLFPADIRQRAIQRRMIREIDNHFVEAVEHLVLPLLYQADAPDAAERTAKALEELRGEFQYWETALSGDWLGGAVPSAADFTLYPSVAMLGRIETRKPGTVPADLIPPKMAAWERRMRALPIVEKTLPPHWR
ncbi:glutathione S-transferase family protein [Ferrovibrio sp.]|uniref:glutathione S-transferase family protein n=1 Tax=Ferrovibrio sp. TaxID=1917215 RepID=UPI0026060F1E|nr:glutathione S-transferase family protein [Ferrovibrio sp.]